MISHLANEICNKLRLICGISIVLSMLTGCSASKVGSAGKGENLQMKIAEKRDIVSFNKLKEQPTPSLASRGQKSRGFDVTPIVGSVVSLATDAIRNVIANEKKKYTASYQFGLTDLYFYDQLSNESAFDPVGMQFSGFKLVRTFINDNGNRDTAFVAQFSLDTSNAYEILNNSVFRLRLEDFKLYYAKAKVGEGSSKKLNMDFEISFQSSFVNSDAVLFDNVALGKFYLFIREAPLDPSAPGYQSYYDGLKGKLLSGKSFIVPRSFGYHLEEGEMKPGYSQGAYTISVNVKESSKDVFVSKVISDNGNQVIESYKQKAIDVINRNISGQ